MNTSFGLEKATPIRVPATANLMIDSQDAGFAVNPWDFQITKKQSLITGFFTRIGATEMVLEWCRPNISADASNNWITMTLESNIYNATVHTFALPTGFYTVQQALETLILDINDVSGGAWGGSVSFNQYVDGGALDVSGAGAQIFIVQNPKIPGQAGYFPQLVDLLDIQPQESLADKFTFGCTDLRRYRYLDFVCDRLTAVQDVKDSSTQTYNRDVLLRWYFAEDVPETPDGFGFPILQGYRPFFRRRIYNPPKQIKWEQSVPVGNLPFSVFDENGNLLPQEGDESEWLMTLQLSEG